MAHHSNQHSHEHSHHHTGSKHAASHEVVSSRPKVAALPHHTHGLLANFKHDKKLVYLIALLIFFVFVLAAGSLVLQQIPSASTTQQCDRRIANINGGQCPTDQNTPNHTCSSGLTWVSGYGCVVIEHRGSDSSSNPSSSGGLTIVVNYYLAGAGEFGNVTPFSGQTCTLYDDSVGHATVGSLSTDSQGNAKWSGLNASQQYSVDCEPNDQYSYRNQPGATNNCGQDLNAGAGTISGSVGTLCTFTVRALPISSSGNGNGSGSSSNPGSGSGPGGGGGPQPANSHKIYFDGDTWIGNKGVTTGANLGIGNDAFVVAGGIIKTTTGQYIPNYADPTTGQLAWNTMETQMIERVRQAYIANNSQLPESEMRCPSGAFHIDNLYLQWGKDIYTGADIPNYIPDHRSDDPFTLFQFNDALSKGQVCRYVIDGSTIIHGSGTIVSTNRDKLANWQSGQTLPGAIFDINGQPHFEHAGDTLGIVNFGSNDPKSADYAARVEFGSGASVQKLAVYTDRLVIDANKTDSIATLSMEAAARQIVFPKGTDLLADIHLTNSEEIGINIPPLFNQLKSPNGNESP